MTRRSTVFGLGISLGGAALLGYAVKLQFSGPSACDVCARPLHEHGKVTATIDGKKLVCCCPACALWEPQQSGRPVRILELTAYDTGARLKPEDAYIVVSSDVNLCIRADHMLADSYKQPDRLDFDRCSPSMIAFSRQEAADAFFRQHGGTVVRFSQLMAGYRA